MNSGGEASSLKYSLKQPILSLLLKNYLSFAPGCVVLCMESAQETFWYISKAAASLTGC